MEDWEGFGVVILLVHVLVEQVDAAVQAEEVVELSHEVDGYGAVGMSGWQCY